MPCFPYWTVVFVKGFTENRIRCIMLIIMLIKLKLPTNCQRLAGHPLRNSPEICMYRNQDSFLSWPGPSAFLLPKDKDLD